MMILVKKFTVKVVNIFIDIHKTELIETWGALKVLGIIRTCRQKNPSKIDMIE